eukprot:761837-Hanusia_phi.AAC.11
MLLLGIQYRMIHCHASLQLIPVSCPLLALQQPQLDLPLRLERLGQHCQQTRQHSSLPPPSSTPVSSTLASQRLPVSLPLLRQGAVLEHVLRPRPDGPSLLPPRRGEEVPPLPVQVSQPPHPEPAQREEVDEPDPGGLGEESVDPENAEEEPEEEDDVGRALDCRREAMEEQRQAGSE